MEFLIFIGVLVLIGLWVMSAYNALVRLRNMVEEGWSGIETQLKRRANLIPNLVETVKGYATHEKSAFEEVTKLRTRSLEGGSIADRAATEGLLTRAIGGIMAVAEAYPDLKANENFVSLQGELSETERLLVALELLHGELAQIVHEVFDEGLEATTQGGRLHAARLGEEVEDRQTLHVDA